MHDYEYVDKMENTNNYHPRAHFIIINKNSLVFNLRK